MFSYQVRNKITGHSVYINSNYINIINDYKTHIKSKTQQIEDTEQRKTKVFQKNSLRMQTAGADAEICNCC